MPIERAVVRIIEEDDGQLRVLTETDTDDMEAWPNVVAAAAATIWGQLLEPIRQKNLSQDLSQDDSK